MWVSEAVCEEARTVVFVHNNNYLCDDTPSGSTRSIGLGLPACLSAGLFLSAALGLCTPVQTHHG